MGGNDIFAIIKDFHALTSMPARAANFAANPLPTARKPRWIPLPAVPPNYIQVYDNSEISVADGRLMGGENRFLPCSQGKGSLVHAGFECER
jgi:hypothetical protein